MQTTTLDKTIGRVCEILDAGGSLIIIAKVLEQNPCHQALLPVRVIDNNGNPHFRVSEVLEYGRFHPVGKVWQSVREFRLQQKAK